MKNKLKKLGIILLSAVLVSGVVFGVSQLINPSVSSSNSEVSVAKVGGTQTKIESTDVESNSRILDTLHKMTHQKIVAKDKWGAIEMTEENIETMTEVVENDTDLGNKEDLLEMLERWSNGNFDSIDKDHNMIWNMQGGSIGKATGKMTSDQEKQFVENNFR